VAAEADRERRTRVSAVAVAQSRLRDADFERAQRLLGAHFGLRFTDHNRELLERGLSRTARAEGLTSEELLSHIEEDSASARLQALVQEVTICETYFFRHPEHFDLLREVLLPELKRAHPLRRDLKLWSAGCATGEEAYSLAIVLHSMSEERKGTILGTDINRRSIEIARRGCYGRWSVRDRLQHQLTGLRHLSDGSFEVTSEIRRLVRFEELNLHNPDSFSPLGGDQDDFDVIFCRNVLMYLLPEAAAATVSRLCDRLRDEGYLVTGALDLDLIPPRMEWFTHDGVAILRRQRPRVRGTPASPNLVRVAETNRPSSKALSTANEPRFTPVVDTSVRLLVEAKRAADQGFLAEAADLARRALACERTSLGLHLLALVLGEEGRRAERIILLQELVDRDPDYVLAHLDLGLAEGELGPAVRASHLRRVLELIGDRANGDMLTGPDPLPVSWVRTMADSALKRLEHERGE
jgi:chemotaxis protein methyltransferase CheR